ncbi:transcriptional adapter 1-like [Anthonomus grandis grandis]|uniref:transcriptional adapter 1-like n=1 Tax=Anthonomus grandis grandis TaxID=2921223 RepID=UPI002166AD40|nr:transcriptional adapter 1-like [Anthonomus grandis grandis]
MFMLVNKQKFLKVITLNTIMDVNEARRNLELALGDLKPQYFAFLRQWFLFNPTLTKEEFDSKVRNLFYNEEQISCHNNFLLGILNKASSTAKVKPVRQLHSSGCFEPAAYTKYVHAKNPETLPSNFTYPKAATELFTPYSGFILCRINIVAWECGMEKAEDEVTQIVSHACKDFLKNIITAMVTKAKGYKIRDGKFQYGFNMPIPDPFLRNSNNIEDETLQSNITINENGILPKAKTSLERTMSNRAFAYAASKNVKTGVTLSTKLLYATIRDNPTLLGQHGIHSVQTLKLSLHDFDDLTSDEDEELFSDNENFA